MKFEELDQPTLSVATVRLADTYILWMGGISHIYSVDYFVDLFLTSMTVRPTTYRLVDENGNVPEMESLVVHDRDSCVNIYIKNLKLAKYGFRIPRLYLEVPINTVETPLPANTAEFFKYQPK